MARDFTFILLFRGGTYISQHSGGYPRAALKQWSSQEWQNLDDSSRLWLTREVFDKLGEQKLVPLSDLSGAWCASVTIDKHLALVNVIATETSARGKKAG